MIEYRVSGKRIAASLAATGVLYCALLCYNSTPIAHIKR